MQLNGNNDRGRRRVRLVGGVKAPGGNDRTDSWPYAMERVIQRAISRISDPREAWRQFPESTIFVRSLSEIAEEWNEQGLPELPQLHLFSHPVSLHSFQLYNRLYISADHAMQNGSGETDASIRKKARGAVTRLMSDLSTISVDLEDAPTSRELLTTLLDHVHELWNDSGENSPGNNASNAGAREFTIHKVHSARRSALRNWDERINQQYRIEFNHRDVEQGFYTYPHVDVLAPNGRDLILIIVSPLDKNFIDSKVSRNNRAPKVTLAIYDAADVLYPGAIAETAPLLKQSFGRILFTSALQETDLALNESYEERASIMRQWVKVASDGLHGVLTQEQSKAPFDAFTFCEAIVKKVLCQKVPGAEKSEIYPFNRAFIFREAGSSSEISDDPIEMRVLEASILSNNPADRGRYLTARERKVRGTEDYECDPADKMIMDENMFRFFILPGDDKHLILSRQPELNKEVRETIIWDKWQSRRAEDAETAGYKIALPELEKIEKNELSAAVYNLFGRLNNRALQEKPIPDPLDREKSYTVTNFNEIFERLRLEVLDRYDERGLYFHYDYGINMKVELPFLNQLQRAYFTYMDDHFQDQDIQYLKDRYRQDNMRADQINEILQSHHMLKKQEAQKDFEADADGNGSDLARRLEQQSKVVFISFSWELHDRNMQMLLEQEEGESGESGKQQALIGREYIYTIVLVADQDLEKNRARLQAEREDLKLFFQMMMRQIWMDKLNEHEYLHKRSRSISGSLNQFLHRVKHLVKDEKNKKEVDDFLENLKVLMEPRRPTINRVKMNNPEDVFTMLHGKRSGRRVDKKRFLGMLTENARQWIDEKSSGSGMCKIDVIEGAIPPLDVMWSSAVVKDAFVVTFKNAVEAACQMGSKGEVTIQVQAAPANPGNASDQWFLDIVIENTGKPIPSELLKRLNAPEPTVVGKSSEKSTSTGIGVFLTRYQLREVIRLGADLIISNVGGGRIQSRIRLPSNPVETDAEKAADQETTVPERDYVLYVEDDMSIYSGAITAMRSLLANYGLDLAHTRGALAAVNMAGRKTPRAVLTDLFILREEHGLEPASKKYGKQFLMKFIELAASRPSPPPIWIFTQEDETTVCELLDNAQLKGYRFLLNGKTASMNHVAPKTISVFSGEKRPDRIDRKLFTRLLEMCAAPGADDLGPLASGIQDLKEDANVLSIPIEKVNFNGEIARLWDARIKKRPDSTLVVEAACGTLDDLAGKLSLWFKHPGLPDSDPVFSDDSLYRLPDHIMHQRLVLGARIDKEIFKTLPASLLYWTLMRNIWISPSKLSPGKLSVTWSHIRHEDKGPVSVLRHDLLNEPKWNESNLFGVLKGAVNITRQLDQMIRVRHEPEMQKLESALMNGVKGGGCITNCVKNVRVAESSPAEVFKLLHELELTLGEGGKKNEALRDSAMGQRRVIHLIEDYLGGESDDYR